MPQYELSISPDYVPDWTVTDAVREIFQNALDQQEGNPDNKMSWDFSKEDECFIISSKDSKLTKDTLLFGNSTKRNDVKTIGTFGEGYKLALLVLCRLGHKVTIFNYGENEIWIPKIINSRRYKSKLLIIDVTRQFFEKKSDNNLTFVIEGVHAGIIADIGETNLHINPPKETIETGFGRILTDPKYLGKVFINGLYVSKNEGYFYGYDIQPEYLTIGRDRNLINSFDLSWITSRMWNQSNKPGVVSKLIHKEAPDVHYVRNFASSDSKLAETLYAEFKGSYGKMAVPVSSQEEYETVKRNYKKLKPIIVKDQIKYIVRDYTGTVYKKATKKRDTRMPHEILQDFAKKIQPMIDSEQRNEFERIIKKSYNWTFKEV